MHFKTKQLTLHIGKCCTYLTCICLKVYFGLVKRLTCLYACICNRSRESEPVFVDIGEESCKYVYD